MTGTQDMGQKDEKQAWENKTQAVRAKRRMCVVQKWLKSRPSGGSRSQNTQTQKG